MGVAAAGDVQFCQYTREHHLPRRRRERLHESTRLVMKTVQNLGFSCRIEDVNAVEAWRGSLPGDGYSQCSSRAAAHAEPCGHAADHLGVGRTARESVSALMPKHSPPLLYAATSGATPFRFNLHVSDLGHTLIVGPSGAGKSTALGLDRRAVVPISASASVRFRPGIFDLDADRGGRRRVLRSCRPEI